jgi:hypothetical protein
MSPVPSHQGQTTALGSPPSLEMTLPVPRQGLHRSSRSGSAEPLRSVGWAGTGGRAYRLSADAPRTPRGGGRAGRTPQARAQAAARISFSGAGRPDQRSNESAPWRTSTSRPSTTTAPARRAADTSSVSGSA